MTELKSDLSNHTPRILNFVLPQQLLVLTTWAQKKIKICSAYLF